MRMTHDLSALGLLALALALSSCGGSSYISPNDPQYARSGAPRAGEPAIDPTNMYGRIMGPGDHGNPSR
jgi:hypothetical protein